METKPIDVSVTMKMGEPNPRAVYEDQHKADCEQYEREKAQDQVKK
jgi:hypothetical protein